MKEKKNLETKSTFESGEERLENAVCNFVKAVVEYVQGVSPPQLENCREVFVPEEVVNSMAYERIRVNIGKDALGKPVYTRITGATQDERNDNIVKTYIRSGRIFEFLPESFTRTTVLPLKPKRSGHGFEEYAENWFSVFSKPNIEASTANTYRRQLDRYWIPAFKGKNVEDITTTDIQDVLNEMGDVAKDTRKKAMTVLKMILEQAVEEDIVPRNVARSSTIRLTGRGAKETEPYTVEQMQFLVSRIPKVKNPTDRAWLALSALHPLRPEEVLGLQYRDLNTETGKISVVRSVTHPDRNQPVVKATKTEASVREIDIVPQILKYLPRGEPEDFIIGGEAPLSYQQVKRMRLRIKKDTGFSEDVVPRRFRTTVLTDIYDETKDIKQTQAAAGHTTADMTLKHYVKGRQENSNTAVPVASRYGLIE